MLAARAPGLLPPLDARELLEVSMIQSVAGLVERGRLSRTRPFRAPHHSASMAAMVGGGSRIKPGEASLAHHGVLFLDELPEFHPQVLDSLRQPLETGEIAVARANQRVTFPARFQLIAAMNPCRCGWAGQNGQACGRGPRCVDSYQARVSGPMMDRIDLQIDVPPRHARRPRLAAGARGHGGSRRKSRPGARGPDRARRAQCPPVRRPARQRHGARCGRARSAGAGGRGHGPHGASLSPHIARGAHHRRSRRGGRCAPHPCGRSAQRPPGARRHRSGVTPPARAAPRPPSGWASAGI